MGQAEPDQLGTQPRIGTAVPHAGGRIETMMQQGANPPSPRQVREPPSPPLHSIVGTVGPVSTDPENVPFNFFYTSNLSLARDWFCLLYTSPSPRD